MCRRRVSAPGAPCGATHPEAVPASTGALPGGSLPGVPPPDPLSGPRPPLSALPANVFGRGRLADDPYTPTDVLDLLAADDVPDVRRRVAANPSTPAGTLTRMAADHPFISEGTRNRGRNPENPDVETNRAVLVTIAGNPASPPETLAGLSRNVWNDVRRSAASNSQVPPDSLARLAGDAIAVVRAAAAVNPSSSPETLGALSRDPDPRVRSLLAARADLPAGLLAELANDPDPVVSVPARSNPEFAGAVASHAGLLSD